MTQLRIFLVFFFRLIRGYSGGKFLILQFSGDEEGAIPRGQLVWSSSRGGKHSGSSFLGGSILLLALATLLY